MTTEHMEARFDVAVIGMSGQFPGAIDLAEFWNNLAQGKEAIRRFTDEELLQRGVGPGSLADPDFVKAAPVLENTDHFAASFFGYSPREAELMDPQHRLFLEHSWAALEDAGYAPRHLKDQVGVFAGMSLSSYLLFNLVNNPALDSREEAFQAMIGSDKDFLCTRLAYKLNLKGPSLTVQTGCSTSLVAAHLAVQNLITYQCDLAITGGVSVGVPQRTGYYYQPGGIASPDGHCRPFDADAQGTVFGEGIGVLVLKRCEDAIRDRDHIYAVIRGSAINNDGSSKIGFTAPGAEGQMEVISRALATAGVPCDSIGYVEAHGTATGLGDPVEVAALAQIFGKGPKKNSCALGAVKSNIGHLDAAAGSAGLIKTVLMLKNRHLVPTLHFKEPNPKIDFSNTPLYVNTKYGPWTSDSGPLRAGVSSFGIGGTNAHIVLEEAPAQPTLESARPLQIVCLSADTRSALDKTTENFCRHIEANPGANLADAAYTLHTGREQFMHRRVLVASDAQDCQTALQELLPDRVFANHAESTGRPVAFMFPGGGSQYSGMGLELYRDEPVFRQEIDNCAGLLQESLGYDLRKLIYASEKDFELASQRLLRPSAGLPAIFSTEYALAKLFLTWGVGPICMIGHSLGEYTAACLAGVFTLEDALRLVLFRGRMFESLASGAMLSVNLPDRELGALPQGVSVAAINTPDQCVLSGPARLIDEVVREFTARGVEHHRLHIEAAAHCSMVEPVMEQFRDFLARVPLSDPVIPFVSNLTGTWITSQQATDADYWVKHLRHTVRFADGVRCIANERECVMLEVGPGRTLSIFARQQLKEKGKHTFSSMRHPHEVGLGLSTTYNALARMWSVGVDVDWHGFYRHEARSRVSLPSYPFERQRYWIAPPSAESRERKMSPLGNSRQRARLYAPGLKSTESPSLTSAHAEGLWTIFADGSGVAAQLTKMLEGPGREVVTVRPGGEFRIDGPGSYTIRPTCEEDFQELFDGLSAHKKTAVSVLHLWTLGDHGGAATSEGFYEAQQNGLYSLLYLTRALARFKHSTGPYVFIISNGVVQVSGGDEVLPEKAGLLAACTVIPQEYEHIGCSVIDIVPRDYTPPTIQRISAQILAEAANRTEIPPVVAYRGLRRWVRNYEPVTANSHSVSLLPAGPSPVYLITGGLGTLGLVLAHHLSEKGPCKIVITTRSDFPEKKTWTTLLAASANGNALQQKIASLKRLEEKGTEVLIARADVADQVQMEQLLSRIEANFGPVDGVVHMAGITGDKALRLVSDLDQRDCQAQFRPKIEGSFVLRNIFRDRPPRFCVLFSSTASLLGGPGMLAYAAASCFLDTFAANCQLEGRPWTSINWDGWTAPESAHFLGDHATSLDRYALAHSEALAMFDAALGCGLGGQIVVSSGDLSSRIDEWRKVRSAKNKLDGAPVHSRPTLGTDYAPAKDPLQKKIAEIWSEVLGIEQIGIHDNLFELGGSSLMGLRIVARLKKELNIDIRVTSLFEGPTIFTLSQLIDKKTTPTTSEAYTGSRKRGEVRRNARRSVGTVN